MDTILQTLRAGGNVLLPSDTAGRSLELCLMLEQFWTFHRLSAYGLAFLTNVSYHTVEFAKSQLEWMSSAVTKSFETRRENPFAFQHLKLFHSLIDIKNLNLPSPMVIVASSPDLGPGFSSDLFVSWHANPKNLVIFTGRSADNSLASQLMTDSSKITEFLHRKRIPLDDAELEEYRANKKRDQSESSTAPAAVAMAMEELPDDGDDNNNDFFAEGCCDVPATEFAKRGLPPLFPFVDSGTPSDAYGEMTNLQRFKVEPQVEVVDSEMTEAEEPAEIETPTKCVVQTVPLSVRCRIMYLDFEGRADARSIKAILNELSPSRVILIHGAEEAKQQLKIYCQNSIKAFCKTVFLPRGTEEIDVSSDLSIYKIAIRDSLLDNCTFVNADRSGTEICYLSGDLAVSSDTQTQLVTINDSVSSPLSAEALPLLGPSARPYPHNSVFVGNLRLADFRQTLAKQGFQLHFEAGVLIVNGHIALWKHEDPEGETKIYMDGVLSEDFFKIRNILYEEYEKL